MSRFSRSKRIGPCVLYTCSQPLIDVSANDLQNIAMDQIWALYVRMACNHPQCLCV